MNCYRLGGHAPGLQNKTRPTYVGRVLLFGPAVWNSKNVPDGGLYSLHMLDPFGYDVQISGFANNALTDG